MKTIYLRFLFNTCRTSVVTVSDIDMCWIPQHSSF